MVKTLKVIKTSGTVVLLLAFFTLSGALPGHGAQEAFSGSPLLMVFGWGRDNSAGILLGGFDKGRWWKPGDLPVAINGKILDIKTCGDENKGDSLAETPLLPEGLRLVYYATDGRKLGVGTAKKGSLYSCTPANGQVFLEPDLAERRSESGAGPYDSWAVGVREGIPVVFVPTKRTENKNIGVSFSASFGGKNFSVAYSKTERDGEPFFKSVLAVGGKKRPLSEVPAEGVDELSGFFIDLSGDGQLEFVEIIDSPVGGLYVYALSGDHPALQVLGVDVGE